MGNCSRLKETKETRQLNAMHNSKLDLFVVKDITVTMVKQLECGMNTAW